MRREFPASEIIAYLIHSMKPSKWYFAFELRELSFKGYRRIKTAIDYGLIQKRHVFGRICQYQLTEKGIFYQNKIAELGEENFIKTLKTQEALYPNKNENRTSEEEAELVKEKAELSQAMKDYLSLRFMKGEKEIIERIGLPASIRMRITPVGESYLKNLKEEHDRLYNFLPYFSERRKRKFNLEEAEISLLQLILENKEISLLQLIRSAHETRRRKLFKGPFTHLLDRGCLQLYSDNSN